MIRFYFSVSEVGGGRKVNSNKYENHHHQHHHHYSSHKSNNNYQQQQNQLKKVTNNNDGAYNINHYPSNYYHQQTSSHIISGQYFLGYNQTDEKSQFTGIRTLENSNQHSQQLQISSSHNNHSNKMVSKQIK